MYEPIDKEDVGGSVLDVLATVVNVGLSNSLWWVEIQSEGVNAHLKAGVERNKVSKRLLGMFNLVSRSVAPK